MVNKCVLIGQLGKDPEFRVTAGGTPMARFSLATTESRKDKDGNRTKETSWHKLIVWGKQAEIARDYLKKGKLLYVEGRISYGSYENKEGQKVYTTDIVVNTFQMLDQKGSSSGQGHTPEPPRQDAPPAGGFEDDDLPF